MINFLHKSLPKHNPNESFKFDRIVHTKINIQRVISVLINFLHKLLLQHDPDEEISLDSFCVYITIPKHGSQMINFLHKSLLQHDPDESSMFDHILHIKMNIQTEVFPSWSVFFTNLYLSIIPMFESSTDSEHNKLCHKYRGIRHHVWDVHIKIKSVGNRWPAPRNTNLEQISTFLKSHRCGVSGTYFVGW